MKKTITAIAAGALTATTLLTTTTAHAEPSEHTTMFTLLYETSEALDNVDGSHRIQVHATVDSEPVTLRARHTPTSTVIRTSGGYLGEHHIACIGQPSVCVQDIDGTWEEGNQLDASADELSTDIYRRSVPQDLQVLFDNADQYRIASIETPIPHGVLETTVFEETGDTVEARVTVHEKRRGVQYRTSYAFNGEVFYSEQVFVPEEPFRDRALPTVGAPVAGSRLG